MSRLMSPDRCGRLLARLLGVYCSRSFFLLLHSRSPRGMSYVRIAFELVHSLVIERGHEVVICEID